MLEPSAGSYIEGGYLLMANQVQPGLLAAVIPGFGSDHSDWMKNLANFGGTAGWIDDHPDELGHISINGDGARVVTYEYGPNTQKILRDLIKKQILVHQAAGAKRILVGDYAGTKINKPSDMARIDTLPISAGGLIMGSPHPAGGCRMGEDPKSSVVGPDHKVHGFENLFVSDSSVFPTGVSMDPSLTIMGFSYVAADHILFTVN